MAIYSGKSVAMLRDQINALQSMDCDTNAEHTIVRFRDTCCDFERLFPG